MENNDKTNETVDSASDGVVKFKTVKAVHGDDNKHLEGGADILSPTSYDPKYHFNLDRLWRWFRVIPGVGGGSKVTTLLMLGYLALGTFNGVIRTSYEFIEFIGLIGLCYLAYRGLGWTLWYITRTAGDGTKESVRQGNMHFLRKVFSGYSALPNDIRTVRLVVIGFSLYHVFSV